MTTFTVKEIAAALGAEAFGAVDVSIDGVAEPGEAGATDLAMAMAPQYAEDLAKGHAKAAVLWEGADWKALGLAAAIVVSRPRVAMAGVTRIFARDMGIPAGIHASAVIAQSAKIGPGAAIGALAVIGENAQIGDNATIASHVSIGSGTVIGSNAQIGAGVRIESGVSIGNDFIAQPGAVIGGDGFSFVTAEKSGVENARETLGDQGDSSAQPWIRIHSVGGVEIGDDVEVGANSTIDQGTIRATRIGNGTKLDNLVQVGHNVVVGENCLLCAQVGIGGSSDIGDHVILGGQTGIADNLRIGDRVISGGGTKVLANVPAGRVILGYPAMKMDAHIASYKSIRRLPKFMNEIKNLQKSVSKSKQND